MESKQDDISCEKGHKKNCFSGHNSGVFLLLFFIFDSECVKPQWKQVFQPFGVVFLFVTSLQ